MVSNREIQHPLAEVAQLYSKMGALFASSLVRNKATSGTLNTVDQVQASAGEPLVLGTATCVPNGGEG